MVIVVKDIINKIFMFLKLKRRIVELSYSKFLVNILNLFWNIKIITGFSLFKNKIKIFLNYNKVGRIFFTKVKFFSSSRKKKILSLTKIKKKKLNFFF